MASPIAASPAATVSTNIANTCPTRSSSAALNDLVGQVFAMFVLTVAAGEAAIGLAILVIYFRGRGTIAVDDANRMKG